MCPVVRNRSGSGERLTHTRPAAPVSETKPAAAAAPGLRSPLLNPSAADLRMTMLDVVGLAGQRAGAEDYGPTTLICTEDGQRLAGICAGPNPAGRCPWADAEGRLPCTGCCLMTDGWTFKVAADPIACPLALLGLASLDRMESARSVA